MQPTASRFDASLNFMKTRPLQAILALVSGSDLLLVRTIKNMSYMKWDHNSRIGDLLFVGCKEKPRHRPKGKMKRGRARRHWRLPSSRIRWQTS